MSVTKSQKQVNMRVGDQLYSALTSIARDEHWTIPQAARILLEEGLRQRTGAAAGGAFDWLDHEPELYDDTCGEPA